MKDMKKLVTRMPELRNEPFIQNELKREERRNNMKNIRIMSQLPPKSGWIILLQNRVNIESVGNKTWATKVYYDHRTRKVGNTPDQCQTHFRMARLKNGQPAAGWMPNN